MPPLLSTLSGACSSRGTSRLSAITSPTYEDDRPLISVTYRWYTRTHTSRRQPPTAMRFNWSAVVRPPKTSFNRVVSYILFLLPMNELLTVINVKANGALCQMGNTTVGNRSKEKRANAYFGPCMPDFVHRAVSQGVNLVLM